MVLAHAKNLVTNLVVIIKLVELLSDNKMIKNSPDECRIQIGEICCSLRFKEQAHNQSALEHYKGFLSEKEPELTIDIDRFSSKEYIDLPNCILLSKTAQGNHFNFHSGLITGTLDLNKKHCSIRARNMLFYGKTIRIFEQFLFQVYYTLLKQNAKNENNNFLIHACAVSKEGKGYLFSGRSGSGKSTIAKLSSDYEVLNDELVIIRKVNGHYFVGSTPFRGDFKENVNFTAPIISLFLIKHGKKNLITKISKLEFVTKFVNEVVYSDTLLSTEKKNTFLEMMDFCSDIADNVPFYELQFLPERSLWDFINSEKVQT